MQPPTIVGPANTTVAQSSAFTLSSNTTCPGIITWYSPSSSVARGNPVSITATQTQTYFARCEQNPCSSPNSNSITITVPTTPVCDITVNGLPASNTLLIGSLLSFTAVRSSGMSQTAPLNWTGPTGSKFFVQSPTNTTTTSYSVSGDVAWLAPNALGTFSLRIQQQGTTCYKDVSITVKPAACGCTDCDLTSVSATNNLALAHSATTDQNYVVETVYLNATATQYSHAISYFDGLGRPIQQVQVGGGGGSVDSYGRPQDVVSIREFDAFGREVRKYLPYSVASNGGGAYRRTAQASVINDYYNTTLQRTGNAFTSINYESSPLSRVMSQTAPGSGTAVTISYRTNTAADAVKSLSYVFSSSTITVSMYGVGVLFVTETTNENNQKTTEYKDKEGRIVCRDVAGLRTYYGYDDFGRLRCVVPPKAASLLTGSSINPFDTAHDLLFAYDYDHRGRQTRKRVPGAGISTMAYDLRDRLTSVRDANLTTVVTSYDELDRVVSTSIAGGQLLTKTYYDNYSFAGSRTFDQTHAYGQTSLTNVQGMATGSQVWGLGNASSLSLLTATYYDYLGRPIQTHADNHLGSVDKSSSKLDFMGRILESKLTTTNNLTIETRQSYDWGSRQKAICQRVTDNASALANTTGQYWEPVARQSYNGLGELTRKTLGCNLQNLDYTYHMRGWLTSLNQPSDLAQNGDKDLFGMSLSYDGIGNILNWNYRSGQKQGLYAGSTALTQNPLMAYAFGYDTQNRLKTATLTQNTTTTVFAMGGNDVGKIAYDDNGNIQNLSRTFNGTQVDNLSYNYASNTNRLSGVIDVGQLNANNGFFNKNTAYSYDANGNLIGDTGKGITSISYNYLNLPQSVATASGTVSYTYTATGQKLRASFPGNKQYDYVGGLIYEGSKLEFIPTAEGRILPPGRAINPTSTTETIANRYYRYEYQLKDHLGNLRVACRCPEISTAVSGSQLPGPGDSYPLMAVQEEQYDPWGLSLSSLSNLTMVTANRFTYNSKEEQQGLGWLDYGARMYDPVVPRWLQVDPMAEHMRRWSPYNMAFDNPLRFLDPDGMSPTTDSYGLIEGSDYSTTFTDAGEGQQEQPKPKPKPAAGASQAKATPANTYGVPGYKGDGFGKFLWKAMVQSSKDALRRTLLAFLRKETYTSSLEAAVAIGTAGESSLFMKVGKETAAVVTPVVEAEYLGMEFLDDGGRMVAQEFGAAAKGTGTALTKNSVIEGFKVSNHAWRKSGLGRGATEELISDVITGARKAGTVITETGTGQFSGNLIKVFNHNGVKVAVDETRQLIMSIRPEKGFKLP